MLRFLRRKTFFGIIFLHLGIILLILKSSILKYVADSILILKPNSFITNLWLKPPEVTLEAHFFHWMNPEDFHNLSIKPTFKEQGPYRFTQHLEKRNVIWNDNDTVTYNQMLYWTFDEENSKGNLSDVITTVDLLTMSFAHMMRNANYFMKVAISAFITANDYTVPFKESVNNILNNFQHGLLDISNSLPFVMPEIPRFDTFGLIAMRNASETFDGTFNIANGVDGNFDMLSWNYDNVTAHFSGRCSKIHGSASELYSRKMMDQSYIDIFVPDMCKTIRLDFSEEVVVYGIIGHKYVVGKSALDNGSLVPGNECNCAGDCVPSGLLNVSTCRYGFPFFSSLPHFYSADPVYLDAIEGLNPEKEKHEAYIILEPKTRVLLEAAARFQMNVLIQPIEHIRLLEDVRKIFFPTGWAEQVVTLPSTYRLFLKIYLILPNLIVGTSAVLICLGLYMTVFVLLKSIISIAYETVSTEEKLKLPLQIEHEKELLYQGLDKKNLKIIIDTRPLPVIK